MKRLVSIVIILTVLFTGVHAYAQGFSMTFQEASSKLLNNNFYLKTLEYNERQAKVQLDKAELAASKIDINGYTYYRDDVCYFVPYNEYAKVNQTRQKLLTPKQALINYQNSHNSLLIARYKLITDLRNLYIALYTADAECKLKQQKLKQTENKNALNVIKNAQGLITKLQLEESQYNLEKAQKDLAAVERTRDNAARNLNYQMGVPNNTGYAVILDETEKSKELQPVEFYMGKALENRAEVISLKDNISLKELGISIWDENDFYRRYKKAYPNIAKDHEALESDLGIMRVQLEKTELDIENEIKQAYISIKSDIQNVENLRNSIVIEKAALGRLYLLRMMGAASYRDIEDAQNSIDGMEASLRAAVFSLNTKIIRLENASGLGPAY